MAVDAAHCPPLAGAGTGRTAGIVGAGLADVAGLTGAGRATAPSLVTWRSLWRSARAKSPQTGRVLSTNRCQLTMALWLRPKAAVC